MDAFLRRWKRLEILLEGPHTRKRVEEKLKDLAADLAEGAEGEDASGERQ